MCPRGRLTVTKEELSILKGTTYVVYRYMVKANKPLSVREVQHALKLSSPSVALYHLCKLEESGFVRRENSNFVIAKVVLDNSIKINRFLVPRHFIYALFSILVLIIALVFFRPAFLDRSYFFETVAIALIVVILCYETLRDWIKSQ